MATTTQNRVTFSPLISLFYTFYSLAFFCHAANILTQGQSIRDGETIVSANGIFEFGFFSPENSTSRYVGIWYKNISPQSVVWVANREKPIFDRSGVFSIGSDGNLMVSYGNGTFLWSSNASIFSNYKTAAILYDTGNLALSKSEDVKDISKALWQSFTNPTDTYLPGMKVAVKFDQTGENRFFTSWKSANDPSPGNFSLGTDSRGSPQIVIWEGQRRRWRSGHWNAIIFTGVPNMTANYLHGFKLSSSDQSNNGSLYFSYVPLNGSDVLRFRIGWDGNEQLLNWDEIGKKWKVLQSQPADDCELYNRCGSFGVCNVEDSPICRCMDGFKPRDAGEWSRGNWSGGCVRRTQLKCERINYNNGNGSHENGGDGDGFAEVRCVKLPDMVGSVSAAEKEGCREMCLRNCSCSAYANIVGIGCMIWSGDLVDVQYIETGGRIGPMKLNIRLAASELDGKPIIPRVVIATIVIVGVVFTSIFLWLLWRFRAKQKASSNSLHQKSEIPFFGSTETSGPNDLIEGSEPELHLFNFNRIAFATNNFSEENKLGEGGFGPVYKGKLIGEQEIAVKRLSSLSGQGLEEFKNELKLIAKLQHKNLVRLLGYCIEGEEKMLLYEYMPNKSLDCFLFDSIKKSELDWRKRFTIIEGIARGLLYLHRDSRLTIIHRDLKASNILLDKDMNPKISDFGMARIFGGNQNEANTQRVVGTLGYMSPEYAMEGLFSMKSDVYSFGVLLLEIVSGQRNISFHLSGHSTLTAHAWNLWNSGKAMELIDPCIGEEESCYENEVVRCIQVGMLCVQDSTLLRPTMSSVVLMLENKDATLPLPTPSAFASIKTVDNQFYLEGNDVTDEAVVVGTVEAHNEHNTQGHNDLK